MAGQQRCGSARNTARVGPLDAVLVTTCGFRTPLSEQKATSQPIEEFIRKATLASGSHFGEGHVPTSIISACFHCGFADVLAATARILHERTDLNRVCVSGGTFNNRLLTQRLVELLQDDGFEVFTQSQLPCGDGGLSLGQAMIATHRRSG